MKQALLAVLCLVIPAVAYLQFNSAEFGPQLPPGLAPDIPIVDGNVLSGRRTLFEDGRGYVIDIQTDLPYERVLAFYSEKIGKDVLSQAPGMGAAFSVGEFRAGNKRVHLEIHSQEGITQITTAVHLGSWW